MQRFGVASAHDSRVRCGGRRALRLGLAAVAERGADAATPRDFRLRLPLDARAFAAGGFPPGIALPYAAFSPGSRFALAAAASRCRAAKDWAWRAHQGLAILSSRLAHSP